MSADSKSKEYEQVLNRLRENHNRQVETMAKALRRAEADIHALESAVIFLAKEMKR